MAEDFTDLGTLPTIYVDPLPGALQQGTGGGYTGQTGYSLIPSQQNIIGAGSDLRFQSGYYHAYNPAESLAMFGAISAAGDYSSIFSHGFGDIGGSILGRTMAGDVLTSYPTAWEMYARNVLDFPPLAATAFGGASYAESRGYPGTIRQSNFAFGAFQWLWPARQDALFDLADEMGMPADSFDVQSQMVLEEFGGTFADNSRLFNLYDPLYKQAQYAKFFVEEYLRAGPIGNARDIGIASAWPNYRTGVTPTESPLFSLVPLPDFSDQGQ